MADLCFVVPVYKVPYQLLQNCIDSILGQTHRNIELILVDDGSPDNCGQICDENARRDSRIRVIHKPNGGLSDARNAGTKVCQSDWITFVDGDDWVDADFVGSFLNRISAQAEAADFYIYNGYRNYSEKEVVCDPYYADGTRFVEYAERESLQKECCMVPTRSRSDQLFIGSGCAKVFRLQFLLEKELWFPRVPYGEDSIFFFYSVEESTCVEYVSKPVYHYRDTEGGMVNGFRKNADTEQQIYNEEIFQFAQRYHKNDAFADALYLRVFISMQRVISQKFFNEKNPEPFFRRWKDSCEYFSRKPYCDIFRHIHFFQLNRNSKIKYILFRTRMYWLEDTFRNLYNRAQGKRNVKRV